jgi:hypothetical protein
MVKDNLKIYKDGDTFFLTTDITDEKVFAATISTTIINIINTDKNDFEFQVEHIIPLSFQLAEHIKIIKAPYHSIGQ